MAIREVHETPDAGVREVREVPVVIRSSNPLSMFLMFLLGIFCTVAAAFIVVVVLGFQGTLSWGPGSVQLGMNTRPAATAPANTP